MFSNVVVFKAQITFDFQWTVYSTWENLKKFTALKIFVKKKMRKKWWRCKTKSLFVPFGINIRTHCLKRKIMYSCAFPFCTKTNIKKNSQKPENLRHICISL